MWQVQTGDTTKAGTWFFTLWAAQLPSPEALSLLPRPQPQEGHGDHLASPEPKLRPDSRATYVESY